MLQYLSSPGLHSRAEQKKQHIVMQMFSFQCDHAWGHQVPTCLCCRGGNCTFLNKETPVQGPAMRPQGFPKGNPFKRKKHVHIWIFCGLNVFITLLITHWVILTGSVLWHGRGSFTHSDKSNTVLKPLEISLPRKEICLLLGWVGEHKELYWDGDNICSFYLYCECLQRKV